MNASSSAFADKTIHLSGNSFLRRLSLLGAVLLALHGFVACGPASLSEEDLGQTSSALGSPDTTIITIGNLTQLNSIRNKLNGNYQLTADINASATANWNSGRGWLPISNFTGTLNGQGYRITNLTIDRPNENFIGLFASTHQAIVSNVGFSSASIRGASYVGTLAGSISDSYVAFTYVDQGTVTSDAGSSVGLNVGLLAGGISGSSIRGSYTRGTVNGRANYVGGLAGTVGPSSADSGEIIDCYTRVTVDASSGSGQRIAGGLVGQLSSSSATNVWSRGTVRGRGSVGGLVGVANGTFRLDFSYSRNEVYDLDRPAWTGGWAGTYGASTDDFYALHFGPLLWDSTVDGSTNSGGVQSGYPTTVLQAPTTPGGGVYENGGDAQWLGWAAGTSTQYHILIHVVRPGQQRL